MSSDFKRLYHLRINHVKGQIIMFPSSSLGINKILNFTEEELADQGIKPNTIRLSIGTEHIDDIIADLQNGFKVIKEG